MNKQDCVKLIYSIRNYFPKFNPDDEMIIAWYEVLKSYEYKAINYYLQKHVTSSMVEPKIAHLTIPYQEEYGRIVKAVDESLRLIWEWTNDSYHDTKIAVNSWLRAIPFLEREKAVRDMAKAYQEYANQDRKSFLAWFGEYER